jgi:hypothetical protein
MILRSSSLDLPNRREVYSDIAHPCQSYPKRSCRTICALEDSAVWAARHCHRKADTSELLKPVPISPGSRYLEHYNYFRRGKGKGEQGPSAFQCRPERVFFASWSARRRSPIIMPGLFQRGTCNATSQSPKWVSTAPPYSCFSSVTSTVAVAPALTVMVLSHACKIFR